MEWLLGVLLAVSGVLYGLWQRAAGKRARDRAMAAEGRAEAAERASETLVRRLRAEREEVDDARDGDHSPTDRLP